MVLAIQAPLRVQFDLGIHRLEWDYQTPLAGCKWHCPCSVSFEPSLTMHYIIRAPLRVQFDLARLVSSPLKFMVKILGTDIASNGIIKLQLQGVTDIVPAPYHSSFRSRCTILFERRSECNLIWPDWFPLRSNSYSKVWQVHTILCLNFWRAICNCLSSVGGAYWWWWSLSVSSLRPSQSALPHSTPVAVLGLSSRCGRRIPWTFYNQRGLFSRRTIGAAFALHSLRDNGFSTCNTYDSTGSQYHWLQIRCVS